MEKLHQVGLPERVLLHDLMRAISAFYVADNKTLAGKEDRLYEGEALGRKLAVVFFEMAPDGTLTRVNQTTLGVHQELLTLAELLQTIGGVEVPLDAGRTAAETEVLLENKFQELEITRTTCTADGEDGVHIYSVGEETNAEVSFALETPPGKRTKMTLARALQRHGELVEESLQTAWAKTAVDLRARAAHLFPDPVPPALPAPRGRGRGRGRAGRV